MFIQSCKQLRQKTWLHVVSKGASTRLQHTAHVNLRRGGESISQCGCSAWMAFGAFFCSALRCVRLLARLDKLVGVAHLMIFQ